VLCGGGGGGGFKGGEKVNEVDIGNGIQRSKTSMSSALALSSPLQANKQFVGSSTGFVIQP